MQNHSVVVFSGFVLASDAGEEVPKYAREMVSFTLKMHIFGENRRPTKP